MPTQRRVHRKGKPQAAFDKYDLYLKAVQSPDSDVEFIRDTFKELRKRNPESLREDFCGTFALSCEWVKLNSRHVAYGVDLDPEPLTYGKSHYWAKLKSDQQSRITLLEEDVCLPGLPSTDIVLATNFSYFIFKTRKKMKHYFSSVYQSLKKDGVFILDCFGGSLCYDANEEPTKHRNFTYYWEQEDFDPISNEAIFHIHFKVKGKGKTEKVFTYDWRLWSLPELRELLEEAGFSKTHVYWEGSTKKGTGNGVFTRAEKGEACESWIAYIAAEK